MGSPIPSPKSWREVAVSDCPGWCPPGQRPQPSLLNNLGCFQSPQPGQFRPGVSQQHLDQVPFYFKLAGSWLCLLVALSAGTHSRALPPRLGHKSTSNRVEFHSFHCLPSFFPLLLHVHLVRDREPGSGARLPGLASRPGKSLRFMEPHLLLCQVEIRIQYIFNV